MASWKQVYLENHVRDLLESYDPDTVDDKDFKKQLKSVVNFVHSVEVEIKCTCEMEVAHLIIVADAFNTALSNTLTAAL